MKHVDDFAEKIPSLWLEHGGVMLPMYQSEALWLNFNSTFLWDRETGYPFAIKVATGKINAVTGNDWIVGLKRSPQDYVVSSKQPWLDGYCVEKGFIRRTRISSDRRGYYIKLTDNSRKIMNNLEDTPLGVVKEVFSNSSSQEQKLFMDGFSTFLDKLNRVDTSRLKI